MGNQINFLEDEIKKLRETITKLENENRLLKECLSEAGVSYADIVEETVCDAANLYDPNQGERIKKFERKN